MATESLAPYRENVRYHLAKQKLQENFLKWLTMPSTTQLINKLVDDCQRNQLNQIVPPSPLFHPRTPASPQVNSPNRNTLTPPLSPSAPDKMNMSPGHASVTSSPVKEEPRPSLDPSNQIPQFYFPKGKPADPSVMEKEMTRINEVFVAEALGPDDFKDVTQHICNLPRCSSRVLYSRIKGSVDGTISKKEFLTWFQANLVSKSPNQRFFAITKKPGTNFLERDDFRPYMRELLDSHPGLEFLKATPEFQERYTDSVLERIFYTTDSNDDAKISLRDLNRSNLVATFIGLDEEEDINRVRDYFSYEHFYVLYCRFWELDSDHDFIIDKEDFARYEGHSLSKKAIDRIFEQIPRKFNCDQEGKMKYEDFVWFMLSEEDKTTTRSLEYWFKVIDLDANGVITPYEMEHFYSEQLHRLEYLNHDVVLFNDILCQMTDMIKPEKENWFVLEDFKRTNLISGTFFNILVNLNKFIAYEQRDPFSIKAEQNENPDYSEWDKFAATEYVRLALEEENAENEEMLDDIDPWDSDHEDQASV